MRHGRHGSPPAEIHGGGARGPVAGAVVHRVQKGDFAPGEIQMGAVAQAVAHGEFAPEPGGGAGQGDAGHIKGRFHK